MNKRPIWKGGQSRHEFHNELRRFMVDDEATVEQFEELFDEEPVEEDDADL